MKPSSPDPSPELRAAYQRFLDGGASSGDSSCPDPEELLLLAEGRAAETDALRTMDHMAQCPECRRDFDLLRTVAEARPPSRVWVRQWMAAAASIAILAGGGYGLWRGMGGGTEPVMRGPDSPVELTSPAAGETGSGEIEFTWESLPDAYEYVFEILDQGGKSLFTHTQSGTSYRIDPGQHPNLEGNLMWWVTARLRDGTERSSETRSLDLSRR